LRSLRPVFCLVLFSLIPTSFGGFKWSPPIEPSTGGRNKYNGVLPGAPRGSFATMA
jgi:hypothetical protein